MEWAPSQAQKRYGIFSIPYMHATQDLPPLCLASFLLVRRSPALYSTGAHSTLGTPQSFRASIMGPWYVVECFIPRGSCVVISTLVGLSGCTLRFKVNGTLSIPTVCCADTLVSSAYVMFHLACSAPHLSACTVAAVVPAFVGTSTVKLLVAVVAHPARLARAQHVSTLFNTVLILYVPRSCESEFHFLDLLHFFLQLHRRRFC